MMTTTPSAAQCAQCSLAGDSGLRRSTVRAALGAVLCFGVGLVAPACSDPHHVEPPPFAVMIEQDRTDGGTATEFALRVVRPGEDSRIESVRWDFGDGRHADSREARVRYDKPGVYPVTVSTTDGDGREAEDSAMLTVFGPPGSNLVGPGGIPMPAVIGDVDGDQLVTMRDAQRIARHVDELEFLDPAVELAGDLDLDGEVGSLDAQLVLEAAVAQRPLPDRMLESRGGPGKFVHLISHRLMDPGARVELEVGGVPVRTAHRPALGYANFFVPLDPAPAAGVTEVVLKLDGQSVARYPFEVEAAASVPDEPLAEILEAMQLAGALRAQLPATVGALVDASGGVAEERALLVAVTQSSVDLLADVGRQLQILMQELRPEVRRLLRIAMDSNGLQPALAELRSVGSGSALRAGLVGENFLPLLCRFERIKAAVGPIDKVIQAGCDALILAATACSIIPGPWVPACVSALLGLVSVCAIAAAPAAAIAAVDDFIPDPPDRLLVKTEPGASPTEPTRIRVELPTVGLAGVCRHAGGSIKDWIVKKARVLLLRRSPGLRQLFTVLRTLAGKDRRSVMRRLLDAIERTIDDALGRAVSGSDLERWLQSFATKVCDVWRGGLPLAPALCQLSMEPDVGSLQLGGSGDPIALWQCGTNSPAPRTTLTVKRDVCGQVVEGTATLACGFQDVTFVFGDNGSLNDDIFELRVNGRVEKTSSVPSRRLTKTLKLAAGEHTVQLVGRAAPDNIGTYYLQVIGAQVKSGPPLSGTDLVPSVTHTWKIEAGTGQ